jgi:microcystin-dependent protein
MPTVPAPGTLATGDSISSSTVRYTFSAPNNLWIEEAIFGMLSDLTNPYRFTQVGAVTTIEASQVFVDIFDTVTTYTTIGTIIPYAGIALPANALPCDGASYLRTDYPELFAILGVLWGSADSTHFSVPDLRGRTLVDSGTGPGLSTRTITDQGGEETHVLTVGELASHAHTDAGHAHTYGGTLLTSTVVPPPLDGASPNPIPASTGVGTANIQNTGSDDPHQNMQPFVVINYGILFA